MNTPHNENIYDNNVVNQIGIPPLHFISNSILLSSNNLEKYPEGKLVTKYKLDHNDVHVERGVWRKYNPYNPYVEGQDDSGTGTGGAAASLESLDDLFADDPEEVNVASPISNSSVSPNIAINSFSVIIGIFSSLALIFLADVAVILLQIK